MRNTYLNEIYEVHYGLNSNRCVLYHMRRVGEAKKGALIREDCILTLQSVRTLPKSI